MAAHQPQFTRALTDHAACRGTIPPTDTLLRYRDGQPLTYRRYDHLWHRLGHDLPWIATQGVSTHWLRHTSLTWVERHFGYGIARAYAGHTDSTGAAAPTYIKASLQDVATALVAMTDEPHPLAPPHHLSRPPMTPMATYRRGSTSSEIDVPRRDRAVHQGFHVVSWYRALVTFPQNGDVAPVFVSASPLGHQFWRCNAKSVLSHRTRSWRFVTCSTGGR